MDNQMISHGKKTLMENTAFKYLMILVGGIIYSVGANLFVIPVHAYNAGSVGFAQLAEFFLKKVITTDINLYAICYVIINVPLFFIAYKGVSRRFFLRTLMGVASISISGLLIPAPSEPLLNDTLVVAIIGGGLTGVGVGIQLLAGGSGGGLDILGVFFTKRKANASVGKVNMIINAVLYGVLLFLFDVETVIYSIIILLALSLAMDKIHYQNRSMRCMIFTKQEGLDRALMDKMYRGVTKWEGMGAYTSETTHVLVTCINKYEEHEVMETIEELDPKAFVIIDENIRVKGNFIKKL